MLRIKTRDRYKAWPFYDMWIVWDNHNNTQVEEFNTEFEARRLTAALNNPEPITAEQFVRGDWCKVSLTQLEEYR